jgi:hypothetical protein
MQAVTLGSPDLRAAHHNDMARLVPEHDAPEVVHLHDAPEVVPQYFDKDPVPKLNLAPPVALPWWRRKRYIILLMVAIVLVFLGAVLGGVLGARHAKSGGDATDSDAASATSTDPPVPEASMSSSPARPSPSAVQAFPDKQGYKKTVAAASWHNQANEEDQSFVAYRTGSTSIQISRYVKPYISDDGFWDEPHTKNISSLDPSSPLAIGQLSMNGTTYIDMTYLDGDMFLSGSLFDTSKQWNDLELRKERELRKLSPEVRIAAYGILMLFSDGPSKLTLRRRYGNDARWGTEVFADGDFEMASDSQLAVVPLSANYTKVYNDRAMAAFYQDKNNKLRALYHSQLDKGPPSWPAEFPDIEMAPGASFSAFSVRRSPSFDNELVTTFIVYQEKSSTMKMLWTDDGKEWQSSSPDGLKGADKDSDIACTTPETLDDDDYWTLGNGSSMTRCYFFEGDTLVKVQLKDREWVNKEVVRVD